MTPGLHEGLLFRSLELTGTLSTVLLTAECVKSYLSFWNLIQVCPCYTGMPWPVEPAWAFAFPPRRNVMFSFVCRTEYCKARNDFCRVCQEEYFGFQVSCETITLRINPSFKSFKVMEAHLRKSKNSIAQDIFQIIEL